jgi:hypothetical protein
MAYDPTTGEFKDDDEKTVEKRITGLLSSDNKYMQQARTQGLQQANRRGLANSALAVTAVEDARIRAALPIASQDADSANQRYMQGRELQGLDVRQGRDIEATRGNLELELGSRERVAEAENAAAKERLGLELTSRERMALEDRNAAMERLETTITADRESQEREIVANREDRQWLAQFDRETQEQLQQFDADVRREISQLDRDMQLRIANMNISSAERTQAASLIASFEASYATSVSNIMANPDIPAEERQKYLDHVDRVRDSNMAMAEQMYGIDLQWSGGTPAANEPEQSGNTGPADNYQSGPYSQGGYRAAY